MDLSSGSNHDRMSPGISAGCPFLGILSDPQTRVGGADSRNNCHLVDPPQSVNLAHQRLYCLSDGYDTCAVYMAGGNGLFPPGIEDELTTGGAGGDGKKAAGVILAAKEVNNQPAVVKKIVPPVAIEMDDNPPNDEELHSRLRKEALTQYENANPRQGRWLWVLILLVAMAVLLVVGWLGYNQYLRLVEQARQQAEAESSISLATAVSEMGMAADTWATAANAINIGAQARAANQAATATAESLLAMPNQNVASTPTPASELVALPPSICQEISAAQLETVSGPFLSPPLGYQYIFGLIPPVPEAVFVVKNTGDCIWEKILLWSQTDNKIITPILRRSGEEIHLTGANEGVAILPGEQVEIVLQYPASRAERASGDWVLMVNDLLLSSQPHLLLDIDGWVIGVEMTSTPPREARPGRTPGSGGGSPGEGTVAPPDERPTPTPPGSRP